MSTMARVRQAISQAHDTIEQTEFAKSLMDGRITRAAYTLYLQQMWEIHRELERQVETCDLVRPFFVTEMIRTPAITRDASVLGQPVASRQPLNSTQTLINSLQQWGQTMPWALLGSLYILEGSRMGSLMIGKSLARIFHLNIAEGDISGLEYHLQDARHTPARVKGFKEAIDQAGLDAQQEHELTLGACQFMQQLLDLYRELPVSLSAAMARSA